MTSRYGVFSPGRKRVCFRRDAEKDRRVACATLLPGQYENPKEIFGWTGIVQVV